MCIHLYAAKFSTGTSTRRTHKTRERAFETHGLFRFSTEEISYILGKHPHFVLCETHTKTDFRFYNKIDKHQKNTQFWRKREKTDTKRVSVATTRLERISFVSIVFEGDFADTTSKAGSPFCPPISNIEAESIQIFEHNPHGKTADMNLMVFASKHQLNIGTYQRKISSNLDMATAERLVIQVKNFSRASRSYSLKIFKF